MQSFESLPPIEPVSLKLQNVMIVFSRRGREAKTYALDTADNFQKQPWGTCSTCVKWSHIQYSPSSTFAFWDEKTLRIYELQWSAHFCDSRTSWLSDRWRVILDVMRGYLDQISNKRSLQRAFEMEKGLRCADHKDV